MSFWGIGGGGGVENSFVPLCVNVDLCLTGFMFCFTQQWGSAHWKSKAPSHSENRKSCHSCGSNLEFPFSLISIIHLLSASCVSFSFAFDSASRKCSSSVF